MHCNIVKRATAKKQTTIAEFDVHVNARSEHIDTAVAAMMILCQQPVILVVACG